MPGDWPQNTAPDAINVGTDGTSVASHTMPGGVRLTMEAVYVEFNTTGGAADPVLTIYDDEGRVIAKTRQPQGLDDSGFGTATWARRLDDDAELSVARGSIIRNALAPAQNAASGSIVTCTARVQHNAIGFSDGVGVDIVSTPSRLLIEEPGVYLVTASTVWTGMGAGAYGVGMAVAGVTGLINSQDTHSRPNEANLLHEHSHVFVFTGTGLITQQVVQNSGVAKAIGLSVLSAFRIGAV